jgi:hypothetical protein
MLTWALDYSLLVRASWIVHTHDVANVDINKAERTTRCIAMYGAGLGVCLF